MEDHPPFDLNRAIEAWKNELATLPGVSAEAARELETHLRECMARLVRRGLNEQEAFETARKQIGSAERLGIEFAKANPFMVWRDRVFWIAFSGLVVSAWFSIWYFTWFLCSILCSILCSNVLLTGTRQGLSVSTFCSLQLSGSLPVVALAILIATGHAGACLRKLERLFQGRWRFALTMFTVVMVVGTIQLWLESLGSLSLATPASTSPLVMLLARFVQIMSWPLTLLSLLVWLFPMQKQIAFGTNPLSHKPGAESQTDFDLNMAIEDWKRSLAARFRKRISRFQERGMSKEDAFRAACRIPLLWGRSDVAAHQFDERSRLWRNRLFWMAVGGLVAAFWRAMGNTAWGTVFRRPLTPGTNQGQYLLMSLWPLVIYIPLLLLAIVAARGSLDRLVCRSSQFLGNRWRVALMGGAIVLLSQGALQIGTLLPGLPGPLHAMEILVMNILLTAIWPIELVALITWLAPSQRQETAEAPV